MAGMIESTSGLKVSLLINQFPPKCLFWACLPEEASHFLIYYKYSYQESMKTTLQCSHDGAWRTMKLLMKAII